MPDSQISEILARFREFVSERDWGQFHNPKDLAIAISIEANELLEHFLWKDADRVTREQAARETADVLIYCFMLCDKLDIDIIEAMHRKIDENGIKYPAEKARGRIDKYTSYETL